MTLALSWWRTEDGKLKGILGFIIILSQSGLHVTLFKKEEERKRKKKKTRDWDDGSVSKA